MGYQEKLKRLCALRGMDQSSLASRVGLTKSSISRILSGAQEPKLSVAHELARALGVTLNYLVDESPEPGLADQLVSVTEEELTVLKIVRHMGTSEAKNRLLVMPEKLNSDEHLAAAGRPASVARRADEA